MKREWSSMKREWSEEGDQNVFKKFCLLEMCRKYWRGSGAGRKVM